MFVYLLSLFLCGNSKWQGRDASYSQEDVHLQRQELGDTQQPAHAGRDVREQLLEALLSATARQQGLPRRAQGNHPTQAPAAARHPGEDPLSHSALGRPVQDRPGLQAHRALLHGAQSARHRVSQQRQAACLHARFAQGVHNKRQRNHQHPAATASKAATTTTTRTTATSITSAAAATTAAIPASRRGPAKRRQCQAQRAADKQADERARHRQHQCAGPQRAARSALA